LQSPIVAEEQCSRLPLRPFKDKLADWLNDMKSSIRQKLDLLVDRLD